MLRVKGLTLAYGAEPILEDVNLEVERGRFATLIGPSGSGKTSILRAITGLQTPRSGSFDLAVSAAEIGFLFQDDALLPWRTARQNVALGLRIRGASPAEAGEKADEWLAKLGLHGLGSRFPRQLSGGQRKRVAIAQVLALEPRLLLMDEPFASLDAIVRTRITQELMDWVEREQLTVLLVTHDLEEAISMSDVVHVLSRGPHARIRAVHAVPIPRPRNLVATRTDPLFPALLQSLWNELSEDLKEAEVGTEQ